MNNIKVFTTLPACLTIFLTIIGGCAKQSQQPNPNQQIEGQRPSNASNYQRDLIYPQETQYFVVDGELIVYEDPFYGAAISYVDKRDYPDIITVFIYPIPTTSWSMENIVLRGEIEAFITELDNTVKIGAYLAHGEPKISDFSVTADEKKYNGKRVHFDFTNKQGTEFNADAYIFMQKDKFIKIRTSSRKDFTPDWNGDLIAKELIPEFIVPGESEFMRTTREKYRRQQQKPFKP